jgi:hypothetical protein
LDDLTRIVALGAQSLNFHTFGNERLEHHGKTIPMGGEVTIRLLTIAAKVNAKYTTIGIIDNKAAYTIGIVFDINTPRAGPAALGEY